MNVMTEEEAKGKWCPFYRRSPGSAAFPTNNRDRGGACLASDCMAWRSADPEGNHAYVDQPIPQFGFCGLAGRPTP